jgi:tRNA threonylcarbamoyladenosine biosynthesis protein TsaB
VKLLAIETSTEACSIAVWVDGVVHARHELAPRRHAELALSWCDALLAEAGIGKRALDAIAVGRGPGAFTGVRLAVALAQGMALALDVPVIPVSTLAALAAGARPDAPPTDAGEAIDGEAPAILAAIDARMGELYLGLFQRAADGDMVALHAEWMARPGEVVLPAAPAALLGVGSGFAAADGALAERLAGRLRRVDATALPLAADLARLAALAWTRGDAIAADRLEPAYLRDKVALTLDEQQQGRAASRLK